MVWISTPIFKFLECSVEKISEYGFVCESEVFLIFSHYLAPGIVGVELGWSNTYVSGCQNVVTFSMPFLVVIFKCKILAFCGWPFRRIVTLGALSMASIISCSVGFM